MAAPESMDHGLGYTDLAKIDGRAGEGGEAVRGDVEGP